MIIYQNVRQNSHKISQKKLFHLAKGPNLKFHSSQAYSHSPNTGTDSLESISVESKSKVNFNPLELAQGVDSEIQIDGAEEIATDRKPTQPLSQISKVGWKIQQK